MNAKAMIFAMLLAVCASARAQFVVENASGRADSIWGRDGVSFAGTPTGGYTFAGKDLGEVRRIGGISPDKRLDHYAAPGYSDYYRSFSGWNDRGKWNLANVHDPTVMRADDGYFYMYTTDASFGNVHHGHGHFMCRRSRNLVDWEFLGTTMPRLPEWVKPKLNEIRAAMGLGESTADFADDRQFGFWAPCVRRVESGLYRMYYAITCPGTIDGADTWSERAFIGMMETSDPADVSSWKDRGFVITNASDRGLNFGVRPDDWANCYFRWNAIDPSYIITPEGEHWLVYGSWHSGFPAVRLNPATGMPLEELGQPWGSDISAYGKLIYTRKSGDRWQASEAPEVIYRDGYYYLFMAYDELSVAYNTRVARSRNIDGPYFGIDGRNLTASGGEAYPMLTHPYKFSEGYGWVGISHCAVFDDGLGNWFYASQGRLPANAYGDAYSNAIMQGQVRRMLWTADGWPVVMPECYGAVPQMPITESELTGEWENITLAYAYQKQCEAVTITLGTDHKVSGSPFNGRQWSFDTATNTLTIGSVSLLLSRETDWEATPRRATIVYAGYSADGRTTYNGKKVKKVKNAYTLMDAMYSEANEETLAAIKEARMAKHKETFDSVESLMEELRK